MLIEEIKHPNDWRGLFSTDAIRRRKALKRLAYGVPMRPCLNALSLLLVRRAFLDGMPVIHYALMRSTYEYMIDLKVKEYHRRGEGLPI